jgi:hypothetical protein
LSDRAFPVEAEDRGLSLAAKRFSCSIQIDEVDRGGWIRPMLHEVLHPCADEGQVGISVSRFDDLLCVRQFRSQIHLVVAIRGALREESAERAEELRHQVITIVHSQGEAPVEVARGRVRRNKKNALVTPQKIAGLRDSGSNVKRLKSALGRHRELQF